ncbi:hypothetical protein [Streptomyces sp. NPDC004065]|uniref:hypothetical protein n=1 Tax=Streptomyces sp. NPDC004065 TaxID=3364689 RepID=UPI00384E054A
MVFRSTWQGLQQWVRTYVFGGAEPAPGLTDEELKAQAIQDERQTRNLIAIENARGAVKTRQLAVVGGFALLALVAVLVCVLMAVRMAKGLELPWSRMGTAVGSLLGASGITGAVWAGIRAFRRRRSAAATPANPSANPAEGDPDQVGTA